MSRALPLSDSNARAGDQAGEGTRARSGEEQEGRQEDRQAGSILASASLSAIVVATAFCLLCALVGASLAKALAMPLWPGVALGLALGVVPSALARIAGTSAARATEILSLALLVVVAVALSARAVWPVLGGARDAIESHLSLLLVAPALYACYMLLNRWRLATTGATVLERLAAALSGPPPVLTLALAIAVACCALLVIHYAGLNYPSWRAGADKFVDRGVIPPLTLALFFWGLLLLANKAWVLWREHRLLASAEGRRHSLLARAEAQAFGNGEVATVDDFIDLVWKKSADFYMVPRYINWAIPILGFIGTVLGISLAADGIQNIVGSRGGLADLSSQLGDAIAPLGIAFDTTLIALSLSVFLMLLQTALQRWEDGVLLAYEKRLRQPPEARNGQPD